MAGLQALFAARSRASQRSDHRSPPEAKEELGLVERFLTSFESPSTRRAYRAALKAWGRYLEMTDEHAARQLVGDGFEGCTRVRRWLDEQEATGASPSLRNQRLATLRALVRFADCSWQLEVSGVPVPRRSGSRETTCTGLGAAVCCKTEAE